VQVFEVKYNEFKVYERTEFMPMNIMRWVDQDAGLVRILIPISSVLSIGLVWLILKKGVVIISVFTEVTTHNYLPT
jgi:hypothetical protein